MSVQAWPFAGPDRPWGADEWRQFMVHMRQPGVITDVDSELLVEPVADVLQSVVRPGMAFVAGHQVVIDADETVDHPTADLDNDRIDLVVLTTDWTTAERRAYVEVLPGAPGAVPAVPAVTQDPVGTTEGVWQEPLAQVLVGAAAGQTGGHTDVRTFMEVPGRLLLLDDEAELAAVDTTFHRLAIVAGGTPTGEAWFHLPATDEWRRVAAIDDETITAGYDDYIALLNDRAAGAQDAFDAAVAADGITRLSEVDRDALSGADRWTGRVVYNLTSHRLESWDGTAWVPVARDQAELLAMNAEQNVRIWQLEADLIGATEGFTGWTGDAFLTGQDNVESVAGDITLSRAARLGDGSVKLANMPAIGEPYMGGFFAGIIDTTQGNIIAGDAYQVGERYALIVSPKSLEGGRDTGTGDLMWRTANADVPAAKTRWDGLAAQRALASATFPAFNYCDGLTFPGDGGSEWYLPALDELELIYRNLKPTTTANQTGTRDAGTFPGGGASAFTYGENPSSEPVGAPYTSGDPAQTAIAAFQEAGAEQISSSHYFWSATWYSSSYAWIQNGSSGYQIYNAQTNTYNRVRPVRRVAL